MVGTEGVVDSVNACQPAVTWEDGLTIVGIDYCKSDQEYGGDWTAVMEIAVVEV